MIRRLKHEVLNLPAKRRHIQSLQVQEVPESCKASLQRLKDFKTKQLTSELKFSLDSDGNSVSPSKSFLELFMASGIAKLPSACKHLLWLLKEHAGQQFVVFGYHKAVLDGIASALDHRGHTFVRIDGQTPGDERLDLVSRFQTSRESTECLPSRSRSNPPRVMLASLMAAGQGITLTAANHVVFAGHLLFFSLQCRHFPCISLCFCCCLLLVELYWNPGHLLQAESRCHRLGQTRETHVHYTLGEGTLDTYMWSLLSQKIQVSIL